MERKQKNVFLSLGVEYHPNTFSWNLNPSLCLRHKNLLGEPDRQSPVFDRTNLLLVLWEVVETQTKKKILFWNQHQHGKTGLTSCGGGKFAGG